MSLKWNLGGLQQNRKTRGLHKLRHLSNRGNSETSRGTKELKVLRSHTDDRAVRGACRDHPVHSVHRILS